MKNWLRNHTMNIILAILGLSCLIFTLTMIWLYILTGGIPDTLCSCFFIAVTGECGFMGWIKTAKLKTQDRQWKLEDKKAEEEAAEKRRLSTLEALKEQEVAYDNRTGKE